MENIHRSNTYVSFVLGAILNVLLLWMIRRKTPMELRPYSRILMQTAVVDMAFLTANLLYHPVLKSRDGILLGYGVGLLARDTSSLVNRWSNYVFLNVWMFIETGIVYSTPLQFYYRHAVLTNKSPTDREAVSLRSYLARCLLPVAGAAWVTSFCANGPGVRDRDMSALPANATQLFTAGELRFASIYMVAATDPVGPFAVVCSLSFVTSAYSLVVWYSVRIWLHMRRMASQLPAESQLRAVNRQLNVVLFLLAANPILVSLIPGFVLLLIILTGGAFGGGRGEVGATGGIMMDEVIMDGISWQPAFNSIAALLAVKAYRRSLFHWVPTSWRRCFCCFSSSGGHASQVAPQMPTSSHPPQCQDAQPGVKGENSAKSEGVAEEVVPDAQAASSHSLR